MFNIFFFFKYNGGSVIQFLEKKKLWKPNFRMIYIDDLNSFWCYTNLDNLEGIAAVWINNAPLKICQNSSVIEIFILQYESLRFHSQS